MITGVNSGSGAIYAIYDLGTSSNSMVQDNFISQTDTTGAIGLDLNNINQVCLDNVVLNYTTAAGSGCGGAAVDAVSGQSKTSPTRQGRHLDLE